MAKRGRKRKNAARTSSGRISRAKPFRIEPCIDRGTDRAQAMQAIYGQDGADAIGRAYRAGFLGSGNEAKALLDKARSVFNAYWSAYGVGMIRKSSTADNDNGSTATPDHERIREREERLREDLHAVNRMGPAYRRAFDQLVIDINPDHGPSWLDSLLWSDKHAKPQDPAAIGQLRRAVEALENIT